jgi:signal transduction histidine kinase/ActR/RegA family two-component response regulator
MTTSSDRTGARPDRSSVIGPTLVSGLLSRLRRPLSLRAKLIGVVLVTTLAALAVALGAMVVNDLRVYRQAWIADIETQAQLLGQTTAPALSFDDAKLARENLGLMRLRPQVRAAAVYNASGAIFARYAATASESRFPSLPEADGAHIRGRDLEVFRRVVTNGEILGVVYLRAEYELYDRVLSYAGIALGVALAAMLVAFVLSSRLQRVVTRPILSISMIAREVVEQRDYSRRAERLSNDEVGDLVVAFNGMMAEIERRTEELERSLWENSVEVSERRAAQQEVMQLNADLERRVGERTAQLEQSNRELAVASDAAERANRAKSEFISSMSHELRTPLNAILGFGQLLSSDAYALPPTKQKEFSRLIVSAGNHLLTLINEILDLARIESAHVTLSLEPVALAELLTECRTLVEPAAAQRHIQMRFPNRTGLGVVADRTRLKQVLLNLLSNAIKYNVEGGTVMIDVTAPSPGKVHVAVRDTGHGLSQGQVGALFQPFNRLGQEASAIEGTGIGLVVTKRLTEMMNGSIGVSSTVGVGTVFWIELNAASLPDPDEEISRTGADEAPARERAADAALPLLLHIEDNPANLRLVEEILAIRGGLGQMSAPDAQLGIELARAHSPQVILLDINLPGLSGLDALAVLRAEAGSAVTPVIALTANAMPRDRAQGLAAGFFRYLTKPIDVDELNRAIDDALDQDARRRTS